MKVKIIALMICAASLVFVSSCETSSSNSAETEDSVVSFQGSLNRGDVLALQINETDKTFEINNSATGTTFEGSYIETDRAEINNVAKIIFGKEKTVPFLMAETATMTKKNGDTKTYK